MRKLPHTAAEDLLELIMRRYERASTLLTSNRPVDDWGKLLGDTAAVTALARSTLHHAHVLKCGPRSWRTKVHTDLRPEGRRSKTLSVSVAAREWPVLTCRSMAGFEMSTEAMRSTMASRSAEPHEPIIRGTGNVFADLGFPDAAERQAKLRLAYALNQLLAARKLSQAEAAKVLGVTQPKVSALRNYKLAGFSVERLMNLLTALDQDVEIVIRRKPRSRKTGRISVVAA